MDGGLLVGEETGAELRTARAEGSVAAGPAPSAMPPEATGGRVRYGRHHGTHQHLRWSPWPAADLPPRRRPR
ncbi:hypothetical protein [Actinoallomurus acaciae]|uniref:Uncharacterized protein n=1 Tax=Actinoallomurus acaciae TaxID=502577 RepID=A0ABV5Y850_9ACTN